MSTTSAEQEELHRIRHSLSHVMAQAVLELRPGSKLGFGPPIDDGFYYDFILSAPINEEDFGEIEKKMRHIIRKNQAFVREELPRGDAIARIEQMGEPYKAEYASELIEKRGLQSLSFYTNGPFLDMCDGPHVANTNQLPEHGFKIRSVAGAYWRGDSRHPMMTRLYAWAFADKATLDAHVKAWKEAQERDHKKLGRELDIFVIDDEIGKGLPLWLPNGTVIRDELEKLAREVEFRGGYQRVVTPAIAKTDIYYRTGHLPYYAAHMFPFMELTETIGESEGEASEGGAAEQDKRAKASYVLRPMNCPHHHKIFASRMRSYRDLPMRLAEYGNVYRFEDSGSLSGLLRVRGMCMNDAHIYCSEEHIKPEFLAVMDLHRKVYEILGISDYYMRFSTWDPEDPKGKQKYVDDPASWDKVQRFVREAMLDSGLPFEEVKGEAAFYGPKIDVQFRTVTGREETASTNQLDFAVPPRLNLTYIGADNVARHPYVIHRAPLGTHERFTSFLIELYGGAFPTWLAPVQAMIVPVVDSVNEYAVKLQKELRDELIRAEVDLSGDRINKKVRNAVVQKIPNILVVGEREAASGEVTLRRYGHEQQQTMAFAAFLARIRESIAKRSRELL